MPSFSSSSSPTPADSTPPTRPVPVPPSDDAPEPTPQGAATPVDAEAEIDASTLRFLSSSFRALFLPWLFRLAVFTAGAKLVRFSSRYLFAAVRFGMAYLWTALGWLVGVLARIALWAGLVATALWCLAGFLGFGAYWLLRARPHWNRYKHKRPVRARYAKRAGAYSLVWAAVRFILLRGRTWVTRLSIVVILAVEAYTFVQQRSPPPAHAVPATATTTTSSSPPPASAASASSSTRSPPPPPAAETSVVDSEEDAADEDLADRWARQVREEMLRESLLAQGKKRSHPATTSTAAPTDTPDEGPEQTPI
ncbi:hypothetical protein JCM3774_000028 [Rhodotorula dairenensis]